MTQVSKVRSSKQRYKRFTLIVLTAVLSSFSSAMKGQANTLLPSQSGAGVELDRAIAIVNGGVLLDSDVDKELRFEALSREAKTESNVSKSTSSSTRDETIERLIDRQLILQQIKVQNEPGIAEGTVDDQIKKLRQTTPACAQGQCNTEAGWNKYLETKGFTAESFHDYWEKRMEVLSFIEERFRSGIRIDPNRVSDYYKQTLVPQYRTSNVSAPPLEKVQNRIQAILVEQEVSKLLDDWLQALRSQGGVVILHPGQAAP